MDTRAEIRDFLTSRRGKVTPEQAGLPTFGGTRRVPGLRREEVALLAGVSADYYTRLELGDLGGVSDIVLESLARALQLDGAEREHLFNLARAQSGTRSGARRRRTSQQIRPDVQEMLDAIAAPAYIRNGRMDILAANALGRRCTCRFSIQPGSRRTPAASRSSTRAPESSSGTGRRTDDAVAVLHAEAGRNPHDRDLTDLIGELSTQSAEFRRRWASHDVRYHDRGSKRICHPNVGDLDLSYQVLKLVAADELTMFVYTAEPGSRSAESLSLLASWAAVARDGNATSTSGRS